jgi:hypothetical protein
MYFSEPVLFELPVYPRHKKYITGKLTNASGHYQPMLVSRSGEGAGLMLWAMAQAPKVMLYIGWRHRPSAPVRPSTSRVLVSEEFSATIGLGIQEFHYTRNQHLLNYPELLVFANFVDSIIVNELYGFCLAEPDVAPMTRIKAFCDQYDFSDDDYNEDTLRQAYLRFRKGQGQFSAYSDDLAKQIHFKPFALAA